MKNLKTIIIIVLAIVVAVAAYFIISDIIANTRVLNPFVTELITPANVRSQDIARYSFKIDNEQTTIELMEVKVKDADGKETTEMQYRLVNEPERELNDNVSTALVQAAALLCVNVIEENPQNISKYGVDYNSYFEVTLKDGTNYKVYFGDVIPVSYNVYVMREGVDKIYTISDASFAMLTIYREYLLSEVVFPGSIDNITSFSLFKKGELEFSLIPDRYVRWLLSEPLIAKTFAQSAEEMIQDTYNIAIGEYVNVLPTQEDYKDYDLLNPAYSIKIEAEGKTVTLDIGRRSIDHNAYYAKFSDQDEVFFVRQDNLGWIDTELMEILYPIPYEPLIANIDAISYIFNTGESYNLSIKEQKYLVDDRPMDNYEYAINNEILQLQYGSDIYLLSFLGVIIVDVDNEWEGPAEDEKPFLQMSVDYDSGNKEIIVFYNKDDTSMYYIRYNPLGDMMEQYTGAVVDSAPITETLPNILGQYTDQLYQLCLDGKNHTFGEWVVVQEPTENEAGLKEKTCTVCGYKINAPIAPIKHVDPGNYKVFQWWIIPVVALILAAGGVYFFTSRKSKKGKDE